MGQVTKTWGSFMQGKINSLIEIELQGLVNLVGDVRPIQINEYQSRLFNVQKKMEIHKIDALYVNAGTNLQYFTGVKWNPSERMVGAIIPREGNVRYILPKFEQGTFESLLMLDGELYCWEEHHNPYALFASVVQQLSIGKPAVIALDHSMPFFMYDGILSSCHGVQFSNAANIITACRSIKSEHELKIMQCANNMTLEVQKAAAKILYEGISTEEVTEFIHRAHQRVGAHKGSTFCIVLFGSDTAYPHGVKQPKCLDVGDVVLIDTGCTLHGYHSDITRSYVFGEPSSKQRKVWQDEKDLQQAAFNAAINGKPCADVDNAVRALLKEKGYGPDYNLPGVSHRTGHGIGMDIHESPNLVGSDETLLKVGMCFSNEPMLIIPGEFGFRHEDHFYMTNNGPRWFTLPMHSLENPFAELVASA